MLIACHIIAWSCRVIVFSGIAAIGMGHEIREPFLTPWFAACMCVIPAGLGIQLFSYWPSDRK